MPRLAAPSSAQVRSILEESYALWGAGLSLVDYVGMWDELSATPWGRKWFAWRAWIGDDGEVLSSLKLYRPLVRLGASRARAAAIGAVYTPRSRRREGHAARLVLAVLDEAEKRGDQPGFLFTDIGTAYYASLGFRPLACEDLTGTLPASRPDRATTFRPAFLDDVPEMAKAHARTLEPRTVAIERDADHWEFLFRRAASFFRRLDGSGLERRFMVALSGDEPIGYVVAVEGGGEWNLREAAAYDGNVATLGRILRAAGTEARQAGSTSIWGWLPRSWSELVPEWKLKPQSRLRAIPMMRPLGGAVLPEGLDRIEAALLPYLDQF